MIKVAYDWLLVTCSETPSMIDDILSTLVFNVTVWFMSLFVINSLYICTWVSSVRLLFDTVAAEVDCYSEARTVAHRERTLNAYLDTLMLNQAIFFWPP